MLYRSKEYAAAALDTLRKKCAHLKNEPVIITQIDRPNWALIDSNGEEIVTCPNCQTFHTHPWRCPNCAYMTYDPRTQGE